METGNLVLSLAGKDKGRLLTIVGSAKEGYVLVADGKLRRLGVKRKFDPEGLSRSHNGGSLHVEFDILPLHGCRQQQTHRDTHIFHQT